jgi:ABC-type multidrug transport system ATPase subunit
MIDQTNGDAYIDGEKIGNQKIQLELGYCPQHPILFDELSVESNLLFYSRIKGIPKKYEKQKVREMLRRVKLLSLGSNSIVSSLSGGMRQRLSIAVALIGDPTVMLLDEPTSDLDPISKRAIWEIISELKEDKSIILTTHSLEEAEVLCDRIGIISKGELQCLGTSIHLKNKFTKGITLVVNFEDGDDEIIKDYIFNLLPKSEMIKSMQGSITFKFMKDDMKLSKLFETIKNEKKINKIQTWSISNSTLEDVYLNIINDDTSL